MKSKPVRKYTPPNYPTRLEIAARPGLHHRHQPPAWCKWPELTGAAGLFLLADTARLSAAESPPTASQSVGQRNAVAIVAPVFEHGKGRGATGCIVVSPPVFLSEEEALQVIREEMAAKGVTLGNNQTEVPGVSVQTPYEPGVKSTPEPFKASAADAKKGVFVEFIGRRQARRWERERWLVDKDSSGLGGTVQFYNMPKTAAYVVKRVEREATNKVYFGTFYDPMARPDDVGQKPAAQQPSGQTNGWKDLKSEKGRLTGRWSGAAEPLWKESRRLLRLQVQDFLKWLEAQGAI
jgi:hypothetical protein